jgi:elongation of very long chain fatty acids protein 4
MKVNKVPIDDTSPPPPSISARLTCVSILVAVFSIWGKLTFVDKAEIPSFKNEIHSYLVPLVMTTLYLVSLPTLKFFTDTYLADVVDVKLLLRESMVLYNAAQVIINGWIVYEIVTSIWSGEHPVVGADSNVHTAASYAIWVHYTDKYLEFFDTYFMVLRGKMDQVRIF